MGEIGSVKFIVPFKRMDSKFQAVIAADGDLSVLSPLYINRLKCWANSDRDQASFNLVTLLKYMLKINS